jgi:hypothetical protein
MPGHCWISLPKGVRNRAFVGAALAHNDREGMAQPAARRA